MRGQRGVSLMEALVVVSLIGLAVAVATANLVRVRETVDLRRLGRQIAADALHARIEAFTSCTNVGLVFAEEHGKWYYCPVEDRDHDGVSRRDFLSGVDRPIGPRVWVEFLSGGVRLGVPAGWQVPDPTGSGTLPPDDGLRIGLAAIMSFSPTAGATPCSVYFNDGRERMLAVRVAGGNGRIRLLEWQKGWPRWREVTATAR